MSPTKKRGIRPAVEEYEPLVLMSTGLAPGIPPAGERFGLFVQFANLVAIRQHWRQLHLHPHLHAPFFRFHHRGRGDSSPPVITTPVGSNPITPVSPPPAGTPPVSSTPVSVPPVPGVMSGTEQEIVSLTNQERAVHGLPPLAVDTKLVDMAEIHSRDMAELGNMDHTLPNAALPSLADRANYVGYRASWLGENIAYGYPDPSSVMQAWINSPPHEANILNPNYTEIGVAIAYDNSGAPYYTQVFAQPV